MISDNEVKVTNVNCALKMGEHLGRCFNVWVIIRGGIIKLLRRIVKFRF